MDCKQFVDAITKKFGKGPAKFSYIPEKGKDIITLERDGKKHSIGYVDNLGDYHVI